MGARRELSFLGGGDELRWPPEWDNPPAFERLPLFCYYPGGCRVAWTPTMQVTPLGQAQRECRGSPALHSPGDSERLSPSPHPLPPPAGAGGERAPRSSSA